MRLFSKLLKNLENYAFEHQPPEPGYIPPLLQNFLQDYPHGFLDFLSTELKLAAIYNILFTIILFSAFPANFSAYVSCNFAATANLLIICVLNSMVLPTKALILRRLREIQNFLAEQPPELSKTHVFRFFYCRVLNFNAKASKILIFAYLGCFYTFFAKFEETPACTQANSLFFLGVFAICAFFLKMTLTYLRFKRFYLRKYLGVGGISPAELKKTRVFTVDSEETLGKVTEKQEMCVVCWEKFQVSHEIRTLHCAGRHFFHRICVDQWLQNCSRCPMCNKTFFN